MNSALIVGVDSVVGANLALQASDRFRVVGLSLSDPIALEGCETRVCLDERLETAVNWASTVRPDWLVYCGPAAEPAWHRGSPAIRRARLADAARNWAEAAQRLGCPLTVVSSDAVFTGPWMFHDEESSSYCDSSSAEAIVEMEEGVADAFPEACIVRTHAFGWSPLGDEGGWLERTLAAFDAGATIPDGAPCSYATPMLATDLAEVLLSAREAGLQGLYHAGGGERISQARFLQRLAAEFELPAGDSPRRKALSETVHGFGQGEMSLNCAAIRKELGVGLPMLSESFARLREQAENGHCERLAGSAAETRELVA